MMQEIFRRMSAIDISYQIRRYLAKQCLTQAQLAHFLEVNISQLNRWVMGKSRMSAIWQRHLIRLEMLDSKIETPDEYKSLPISKKQTKNAIKQGEINGENL